MIDSNKIELIQEHLRDEHLQKLEALRKVYLGIKTAYCCTFSKEDFEIIGNSIFQQYLTEIIKYVVGRAYVLLADGKRAKYNTVSFKILIDEVLNNTADPKTKQLVETRAQISKYEKRHKKYRDKYFAHIELDNENKLPQLSSFDLTYYEISELIELLELSYDELNLRLQDSTSDHSKTGIESISKRIWEAYEHVRLVKKPKAQS